MKKCGLVAAIAFALSGCGGSDKDIGPSVDSSSFNVTAIDGYLRGAKILVDVDGKMCADEVGETEDAGIFAMPVLHKGKAFCVNAVPKVTIDEDRGLVVEAFQLRAPAGMVVITPFTDMLVDIMEEEKKSLEDAKEDLLELFEEFDVPADILFGDFIIVEEKYPKLAVLAATMVDYKIKRKGMKFDREFFKINVISVIVKQTPEQLLAFEPSFTLVGGKFTFEVLYRPVLDKESKDLFKDDIEVQHGDVLALPMDLATAFYDINGDTLAYDIRVHGYDFDKHDEESIAIADAALAEYGLTFDRTTGELAGTFDKRAGKLKLDVYAVNADTGVYSRPLSVDFDIISDALAPEIDEEIQDEIQEQLDALALKAGDVIDPIHLDLTGLFEDQDSDNLDLGIENSLPLLALEFFDDHQLGMEGTAIYGKHSFMVTAFDGITEPVKAEFEFEVAKADVNNAPLLTSTLEDFAHVPEQIQTAIDANVEAMLVIGQETNGDVTLDATFQTLFIDLDGDALSFEFGPNTAIVPDGLMFNEQGWLVFNGTPVEGVYPFTIVAKDEAGDSSEELELTLTIGEPVQGGTPTTDMTVVAEAQAELQLALDKLSIAGGDLGATPVAVEFDLNTLFTDAVSFAVTDLAVATGDLVITVNDATGQLEFSGTAVDAGDYIFTVTATDAADLTLATEAFTVTVYDAAVVDATVKATKQAAIDALPLTVNTAVTVNTPFDFTGLFLNDGSGVEPTLIEASELASTLVFDPVAGTLNGTPNAAGSEVLTLTARYTDDSTAIVKFVVTVAEAPAL